MGRVWKWLDFACWGVENGKWSSRNRKGLYEKCIGDENTEFLDSFARACGLADGLCWERDGNDRTLLRGEQNMESRGRGKETIY